MRLRCKDSCRVLATALALSAIAGCGNDADVPSDAVVRVGDTLISKEQVRALLPRDARPGMRRRWVEWLIAGEWIKRDAAREGVSVPESTIRDQMSAKDAATPTIVSQLRVTMLLNALIAKAGGIVTEHEVARYYSEYPREYATREVRYIKLVATDSRRQAEAAKRSLAQGQGWPKVISRYTTSHARDVLMPSGELGLQPREFPKPMNDAVFAARKGTIRGPVKVERWWYVFEVMVSKHLPHRSLAQVRETIRDQLEAERQARANRIVRDRLRDRYRSITVCGDDLALPSCRNGRGARTQPAL